jgi:hypothetical protein
MGGLHGRIIIRPYPEHHAYESNFVPRTAFCCTGVLGAYVRLTGCATGVKPVLRVPVSPFDSTADAVAVKAALRVRATWVALRNSPQACESVIDCMGIFLSFASCFDSSVFGRHDVALSYFLASVPLSLCASIPSLLLPVVLRSTTYPSTSLTAGVPFRLLSSTIISSACCTMPAMLKS